MIRSQLTPILLLCSLITTSLSAQIITFFTEESDQIRFAAAELSRVLPQRSSDYHLQDYRNVDRVSAERKIFISTVDSLPENVDAPSELTPEGFEIRTDGVDTWIIGADEAGAMYGTLELAEVIQTVGIESIDNDLQNPYMSMRGVKFNIPLDVRTPSYSDVSDAAQNNIAEVWNFEFWREYIDHLARFRYNYVSLWNLHPFPSMVRVPEYPDVALDDVQRSTVDWDEHYHTSALRFDAPEIVDNVETLKEITIDEKMDFWRKVMAYGKSRNVDFYIVTWNTFDYGTEGKYGIDDRLTNPTTTDYFRKSVRQLLIEYPDLRGIGLTTGENMEGATFQEKEDWAFETYGKGVLDAAEQFPGRKITFIHRQHQTGAQDIAKTFKPVIDHPDIEFIFSFKYAKAHVYSAVEQPYHEEFVKDIGDIKTIWTLRNDDTFYFRWGDPDFVREFVKNIPYDVSRGYYFGSDQYIWGREFMSREPEFVSGAKTRELEISKHWFQWMLWGRFGYNPELNNERIEQILANRYAPWDGSQLFRTWQSASSIYATTTGFHWGPLDFHWYIEACQGRAGFAKTPTGFHDVNRFITLPPHPKRDFTSIPDFVKAYDEGEEAPGKSPIDVSYQLKKSADQALQGLIDLGEANTREHRLLKDDIRAVSYLGKYYGHKIRAATELALFRSNGYLSHQTACHEELNAAASYWRRYASLGASNYQNPLWTNRVGHVNWRETMEDVLYDITLTGGAAKLSPMQPTPGGTILEAEEADFNSPSFQDETSGYTGSGYLDARSSKPDAYIKWNFNAPESGTYILEFRYTLAWQSRNSCPITINGKPAGTLQIYHTGNKEAWAWDRMIVHLEKGSNEISLHPARQLMLDHLNIIDLSGEIN